MAGPRPHILFFAEGATMAHFVRPLSLAQSLDPERFSVSFYAPARFHAYLHNPTLSYGSLETISSEQFLTNLAKGAPLFSQDTLRGYVHHDREIIRKIKPDLIVGDLRLSLPISARLENTPFAMLMNAYWNPRRDRPRILPEIPLTRLVPPKWLGPLFHFLEPVVSRIHVGQMNEVRREFGIAPLPHDFGHMYMDADFVLHPDVAEFIRLPAVPQNHFFLGMCDWSPSTAPPDWWGRLLADPRPKVLVALGSSGPVRILPDVLRTLQELQVAVIVATSGRDVPVPPGVYAAGLLPLVDIMKLADLVISHGGSPLVYPALAAGCPSLGIPSNADQHLSTDLLIRSGAGLGLRVEEASASRLKHSIQKLLSEPDFRNAARQWQATFAQYDFKTLFPKFVGKALHLDQGTTGDAV